jgi:hypothetical protein
MAVVSKLQTTLDDRLWAAIQMDAPYWFLSPIFKTVFTARGELDEVPKQ